MDSQRHIIIQRDPEQFSWYTQQTDMMNRRNARKLIREFKEITNFEQKQEKLLEIQDFLKHKESYKEFHLKERNDLVQNLVTSAVVIAVPRFEGKKPLFECEIRDKLELDKAKIKKKKEFVY